MVLEHFVGGHIWLAMWWNHINESVDFLFFVSQGEFHRGIYLPQDLEYCLLDELHVFWGAVVILTGPAIGNSHDQFDFTFLRRSLVDSRPN
jgi:hypothetical protein